MASAHLDAEPAAALIDELLGPRPALAVDPILPAIAAQAAEADRTRTVSPEVIAALKASDVVRLSASANINGLEASILQIGRELEAIAAACCSTGWVMWNHLCVFHLVVGCLGPDHADRLAAMVANGETVCFPGGAGTGVTGVIEGDQVRLNGRGSFGSGGRYADWTGVAFVIVDGEGNRVQPLDLRMSVARIDDPTIKIDPTWDGSAVRASATDDMFYTDTLVPLDRCVAWYGANRAEALREVPVVAPRYREDWVGLSDLWLAWMGVGLVRAALTEAVAASVGRKAILGRAVPSLPPVQLNLGQAAALVASAAATAETGCRQVDDRIAAGVAPTEADYLRQMALATSALDQLDEAMRLILRSAGGNGLREGGLFERRYRDFQAMPVHINAHRDRVHLRLGRFALDEPQDPF